MEGEAKYNRSVHFPAKIKLSRLHDIFTSGKTFTGLLRPNVRNNFPCTLLDNNWWRMRSDAIFTSPSVYMTKINFTSPEVKFYFGLKDRSKISHRSKFYFGCACKRYKAFRYLPQQNFYPGGEVKPSCKQPLIQQKRNATGTKRNDIQQWK